MPVSYEYSIGSVRAREKNLLSRADLESLLALKDNAALAEYLRDKGYGEGESVNAVLKKALEDAYRYLCDIVPDSAIFDALLYPNDAHNIKAVMKGLLSNTDYRRLFLQPCTVNPQDIETAIKEHRYSLLPEAFSAAAEQAYEILAHTADARLSDAFIDNACMTAQMVKANETKIPFLTEYIATDIFYRNVKIALRGAKTGAPVSYYETALYAVDGFDKKEVVAAALKGEDAVVDYLAGRDRYRCADAMEAYRRSPAAFEKTVENHLMALAIAQCRRAGSGPEAALGYFLAFSAQNTAVHIIAAGKETGASPEITRERLRDIYGG